MQMVKITVGCGQKVVCLIGALHMLKILVGVCLIAENDIVENTSLVGLVILLCLPYSGCAFNCPDPTLDDDDDLVMMMLMIGCQCHPVDILASIFWVKYFYTMKM